ncbi:MAG TPA: protein kinase [Polyangiaceae bacterium]|nr:protein kinase [Polyangiaceae bacterium]
MAPLEGSLPMRIDRYELYDVIASGGMATVHLGRLLGPAGFGRTVAIKRLHPHLAKEAEFVTMLTDEARVAARIGHPNIVPTLDIVASQGELFLVMEYVPGLTLAALMKNAAREGERVPVPIACAIMAGVLRGLDAAHEARDESSRPLEVVHRDVSPQNILVGTDGVARLLDFGIAKAVGRLHTTRDGQLKGKVGYMAPEQLSARAVDRRTDIYAASVVLWEVLTGERLFDGDDAGAIFGSVLQKMVPAPSTKVAEVPAAVDMAVLSGLEREPSRRFARAREMATAIENGAPLARASEIAEWVAQMGEKELAERANVVAGIGRPGAVATARAQVQDSSAGILMAVGEATAAPRSRRRALWIVAAAVLSISAGGVVALQRRAARSVDVAAPLTQVPTTVTAGTSAPAALPGADPAAIATPRPAEAADPLPTSPSPGKTSAAGRTNPAARAPASKSRAAKAAACDPPFTIDDQGHKHYKVDCL